MNSKTSTNKSTKNTKQSRKEMEVDIVHAGTHFDPDRKAILEDFKTVRKRLAEKQKPKEVLLSKLLQLKFLIEDYIENEKDAKSEWERLGPPQSFGTFLKEYIRRIDKKSKEFAEVIDVNTTELSLIINNHRKPTEKIIYRLEIHSNHFFPSDLWFRILEKDRQVELQQNKGVIEKERKHVREVLPISL
jgi:plasmid maintenance system antidote protein VapI